MSNKTNLVIIVLLVIILAGLAYLAFKPKDNISNIDSVNYLNDKLQTDGDVSGGSNYQLQNNTIVPSSDKDNKNANASIIGHIVYCPVIQGGPSYQGEPPCPMVPLANATVSIYTNSSTAPIAQTLTDANGNFSVSVVEGTYGIQYHTQNNAFFGGSQFSVKAGETKHVTYIAVSGAV